MKSFKQKNSMQKIKKQVGDLEFETALSKFELDIRFTRMMLVAFCVIATIVRFILKVPVPAVVILIMFIWFLLYFVYESWIKKAKTAQQIYDIYFRYNIGDIFFLTIIIHYLGGVGWIGAIFYVLVLTTAGVILPKKQAVTLGMVAALFYSTMVLLEYFGTIPHHYLFLLKPDIYKSSSYVWTQILVVAAILYFVAEIAGNFSEILREKTRQLEKAYRELEETERVLEVRVIARTAALEELTQKQEEVINERTKELQQKIEELERFQRLAVGRELRMVELKKKIRELESEIGYKTK